MNGLRLLTLEEKNALAVLADEVDRCREEDDIEVMWTGPKTFARLLETLTAPCFFCLYRGGSSL